MLDLGAVLAHWYFVHSMKEGFDNEAGLGARIEVH